MENTAWPPFSSPEFDSRAKAWLEELIRRAKAQAAKGAEAGPGRPVRRESLSLTVPVKGGGTRPWTAYAKNVYNLHTDPLGLMPSLEEVSRDALEDAVLDAGFNGFIAPPAPGMRGPFTVILGEAGLVFPAPGSSDASVH